MKEEIEKLAEEYVDKCPKRYGFVIRSDAMKHNFIDLFVAGYNSCLEKQKKRILELEAENAKLERDNEALCNRILSLQEGFGKEFDLQNKRIDKLKDELKKIRVAYIYAQVGNVIAGTDIDSLFEKMFGKKENVVIWHDLLENPDDLPDCSHGHTVFNQDLDRVIIRDGRFEYTGGGKAKVIAWCEISNYRNPVKKPDCSDEAWRQGN